MKDSLLLLLTASCASLVAWLFWHLTGSSGSDVLAMIVITTLFADNLRLRRKLRK